MQTSVRVFVVAGDGLPSPESEFTIEAGANPDDTSARARESLVSRGRRVRCVSFTPTGLVAYVEPAA